MTHALARKSEESKNPQMVFSRKLRKVQEPVTRLCNDRHTTMGHPKPFALSPHFSYHLSKVCAKRDERMMTHAHTHTHTTLLASGFPLLALLQHLMQGDTWILTLKLLGNLV